MAEEVPFRHLDDPDIKAAFVSRYHAEAMKFAAEAREASARAEQEEIDAREAKREEEEALAGDKYHHTYQFTSEVSGTSVNQCIERLSKWSRQEPGCHIEVIFNSPGGGVIAGMALFDFLLDLRAKGHDITTVALGYAASMAGILLQAGTKRVMGREAWVLIHEVSFSAIGKIGEVEDTTEWVKRICKRVVRIFAERSKLTPAQIEKKWKRKDWWLSSDECLKLGLVDEVR